MKDTPPEVRELYRSMLMNRSGAERLEMACDMFDTARTLVLSNLKAANLTEAEIRVQLFIRTYGRDFDPGETARIVETLTKRSSLTS